MSVLCEIRNLIKNICTVSDGQASIVEIGGDMNDIKIVLKPDDGPYRGGAFVFQIKINPKTYEFKGPEVQCLTHVYHPNIDTEMGMDYENFGEISNVCLNMFKDWQSPYRLDGLINGLLFLFHQPNLDDPYSSYFDSSVTIDDFEKNVRNSLLGKKVCGIKFRRNICRKRNRKISENFLAKQKRKPSSIKRSLRKRLRNNSTF